MLVRLQRFHSGQLGQQFLRLVDQSGQALRADVGSAMAVRQTQQRHFLHRPIAIDALGYLRFSRHVRSPFDELAPS